MKKITSLLLFTMLLLTPVALAQKIDFQEDNGNSGSIKMGPNGIEIEDSSGSVKMNNGKIDAVDKKKKEKTTLYMGKTTPNKNNVNVNVGSNRNVNIKGTDSNVNINSKTVEVKGSNTKMTVPNKKKSTSL